MKSVWYTFAVCFALSPLACAQGKRPALLEARSADWPMYNRDLAGTRYSPLAQINTKNAAKLTKAWSFKLDARASEATPIVVNDVMYLPAGNSIVALEPETGKEIWRYKLDKGAPSRRGVTYWPGDQSNPPRIIFTTGRSMMALNARTGKVDPGFGKEGEVDLTIPYNSAPTLYNNTLFVGANVGEIQVPNAPGDTRAYDVRTGKKVWEFHSVPRPGETGNESWENGGWKDRTGVNNWGFSMTVDIARHTLYTTYGSPASDFYGADRKGNDLFGNSVVALDPETGKMKWFFQAVHHDLWDFDLPPAPGLIDVTVNGKKTPILAQTGKVGYMFILNRETGQPVFGVKETPVPQSQVPGEFSAPTQPIPVKPPPFGRMSFKMEDLVTAEDTSEEHAKACRDLVEKSGGVMNDGPFTTWAWRAPNSQPTSSVIFPGAIGGANWGGTASDPKLGYVYVFTNEYASIGWIEKQPEGAPVPYQQASILGNPFNSKFWWHRVDAQGRTLGASSWPCQKPPWGRLTAVNAATGEFAWQVRLGVTDELPEGKRNTGRIGFGGPIVTAGGLVFIGATNDKRFRAFDSRSGKLLWETKLDYSAICVPMTYQGKDGKQYVAVVAGDGGAGVTDPAQSRDESLVVFALP
ncbi:MAG TPA: PQQ-binding-like beta-propeller repeat protein [Bryobacteraceae bacterium]|nr:PQQ-binding-like beta-propeller repeat protein [Bryobacteraceae bacterium]